MKHRKHGLLLAAALVTSAFAAPGWAQTAEDKSMTSMFKLERVDSNKDRMVSREEFLAQMGKVWDMKVKEMKIQRDRINEQEMQQILMYLRAGG